MIIRFLIDCLYLIDALTLKMLQYYVLQSSNLTYFNIESA